MVLLVVLLGLGDDGSCIFQSNNFFVVSRDVVLQLTMSDIGKGDRKMNKVKEVKDGSCIFQSYDLFVEIRDVVLELTMSE